MTIFLIPLLILAYGIIGTIYGGYLSTQVHCDKYHDDSRNTYPWSIKEYCMARGALWIIYLTWDLLHIPGNQIVKIGVYLGEKQLARQEVLLARQQALRVDQEKMRVHLSKIEEEALQEAEECCQQEKRA